MEGLLFSGPTPSSLFITQRNHLSWCGESCYTKINPFTSNGSLLKNGTTFFMMNTITLFLTQSPPASLLARITFSKLWSCVDICWPNSYQFQICETNPKFQIGKKHHQPSHGYLSDCLNYKILIGNNLICSNQFFPQGYQWRHQAHSCTAQLLGTQLARTTHSKITPNIALGGLFV